MPPHEGAERRPEEKYFAAGRPHPHSQGNLYVRVPFLIPSAEIAAVTVVSRDVMLVTRSCDLDNAAGLVHVAPLTDLTSLNQGQVTEIKRYDCFHNVMYLPAEDGLPERLVNFGAVQVISFEALVRCTKQAELTYLGTQQLWRKLVLHWTGAHLERPKFNPPADDFD